MSDTRFFIPIGRIPTEEEQYKAVCEAKSDKVAALQVMADCAATVRTTMHAGEWAKHKVASALEAAVAAGPDKAGRVLLERLDLTASHRRSGADKVAVYNHIEQLLTAGTKQAAAFFSASIQFPIGIKTAERYWREHLRCTEELRFESRVREDDDNS